jgi:hypothetical protein
MTANKADPKKSLNELALLEEEKNAFLVRLRIQLGARLKKYKSVHVQVRDLAGQRIVSFSGNSPSNKGVVIYLNKDFDGATRIDVHAGQLRGMDVDWVSLLLPFGTRWSSLNLTFKRIQQTLPQPSQHLDLNAPQKIEIGTVVQNGSE